MKRILLLSAYCLLFCDLNAQSKKELEEKILIIEERQRMSDVQIQELKSENATLQSNISKLSETIGTITKQNEELQKTKDIQDVQLLRMKHINDSLTAVIKAGEKLKEVMASIPRNESDSIIALIQSFYACDHLEDRVHFVLNPLRVKPLMQSYYQDNYRVHKIPKDEIFLQGSGYKLNDVFKVLWKDNLVYCKKTTDGYKIDWEATTGYNPVSIKAFKAGLAPATAEYRVLAEIDSYYNFSFIKAQNTHWSIRLVADESLAGYITKSSPDGMRLNEILKDGQAHQLILELTTDPEQGSSGGIAVVNRIVSESWSKE